MSANYPCKHNSSVCSGASRQCNVLANKGKKMTFKMKVAFLLMCKYNVRVRNIIRYWDCFRTGTIPANLTRLLLIGVKT